MGLLDSVIGALADSAQGNGQLQDAIGKVGQNPQLLEAVTSLLGNGGEAGGLAGLMNQFQQAGLGDVIGSWVGSGQNQSISVDQMSKVLSSDALSGLASNLGLNQADLAGQMSAILPGLVDGFTPAGEPPQEGLGDAGDLMGALGSLLKR